MAPPGSRHAPGSPAYGKGPGHYEVHEETYRGPISMAVGIGVCCCTCCPCGFFCEWDRRQKRIWVVDASGHAPVSAPLPMSMGAPAVPGHAPVSAPPPLPMGRTLAVSAPSSAPGATIRVRCGGTCGHVLNVQPQGVGLLEFECPHCHAKNQVNFRGRGGDEPVSQPSWWPKQVPMGEYALCGVSNKEMQLIQQLLDLTWKEVETRDRIMHGGGQLASRFQVVQVQQNCNPKLWENYVHARTDVASRMGSSPALTCRTSEMLGTLEGNDLLGPLDSSINEFLLFHGTKPSAVDSICKSDFMVQKAGSNAGSLYGPGIYFAECSSKGDEYATDDPSGIYQGLYAMLLCRVTCGRMLYTDDVKPDKEGLTRRCTTTAEYDSVLGDREKARGTYREFVVYNNDQAYPAYVILYKRVTAD